MKLSLVGRWSMALFASMVLGLGMTACGGGTIGYMWVLGQQYNQVGGFKIDDYTGNLTEIPGSPFASNGSLPVSIQVKSGGRYVYVVNQGTGGGPQTVTDPTTGLSTVKFVEPTGAGISLFSVGGEGTLTFQQSYQSQGFVSQWAQMDSSGTYLYVLDKYAPEDATTPNRAARCLASSDDATCVGSITVFAADTNTGRLTLITNSQTKIGGINTNTFNVGKSPFMMKSQAGCLYTVDGGDQSIFPLSIGTGGQLLFNNTNTIPSTGVHITSINGAGSYIFLTDSNNGAGTGRIIGFTSTGTCNLTALNGGTINNTVGTSSPVYSLLDSRATFLYVLNNSTTDTTTTTPYSSISAFFINTSVNELQEIVPGSTYQVGSGPVCMVEDPSNQYFYVSNHNDGTISGRQLDTTRGQLSQLKRGSTFATVGQPSCLAVSGSID